MNVSSLICLRLQREEKGEVSNAKKALWYPGARHGSCGFVARTCRERVRR